VIFLLVAAAVVVAAPLAAAVLVTVASLREDSARSLAGRPSGWLTAAARRLLRARTSAGASRPRTGEKPATDWLFQDHVDPTIPLPRSDGADQTLSPLR
jgi:hypothetical protein